MKFRFTIFLFFSMFNIQGQNLQNQNCIDLVPHQIEYNSEYFDYELIRGNTDKKPQILFNDAMLRFSYVTEIDSIWNKFIVPEKFIPLSTSSATINLDNSGREELLIKGLVKNDKESLVTIQKVLLVINIDSIPTQICKIVYGCIPQSIYNKDTYTVWNDSINCSGSFEMNETELIIKKESKTSDHPCCSNNCLISGKFIMKNGRIMHLD